MNTRGASGRAEIDAQPQRVTRSTQRNNIPTSAPPPQVTRISQPLESVPQVNVLDRHPVLERHPVARRGPPAYALRESSIPSIPQRPDDDTEFYDDEEEDDNVTQKEDETVHEAQDGEVVVQPEESEYSEQPQAGLVITSAQRRVLELTVPDLANAADSLFRCLRRKDPDQDIFRGSLSIKKRAFYNIRAEYDILDQDNMAPFIDFAQFLAVQNFTKDHVYTSSQIACANVVSAYDKLHDIKEGDASDVFEFFQTLHETLPSFFILADEMYQAPECTLDLRTWLFVEVISQPNQDMDYRDLLVALFCRDQRRSGTNADEEYPSDYAVLFSGNYFRELGGKDHDLNELCSTRIAEIMKLKRDGGIAQLRTRFPLHSLVDELQKCFESLYKILTDEESVRAATEPIVEYQQSVADSQADDFGSESQSIVRMGSQEAVPSLFVDKASLRALQGGKRTSLPDAPPSNQQRAASRSAVPRDYHQHTNAELMRSPFPPASSLQLGHKSNANHERGQKRPRSVAEDDDGDSFETDNRPIDQAKRDELRRRMAPPPIPHRVSRPPQKHVPDRPQSSGSEYPSFQQESSQPPSSMPDFDAIRQAASQRAKEARMADSERSGGKQRVPWSQHDSQVLINLIAEYGVRWSTIETRGEPLFEYPRNQQAYRDRARNVKTELLIIDVALPPNFDGVALSNKEIIKIKAAGKNPNRREEDVDEQGNPINTELVESTPF
ncbi:hypothetical protein FAVG1_07220 [Fusarium avenaceum]|nr:hypothetical protein FAVG1_07220 [Fusarium avenaceum]